MTGLSTSSIARMYLKKYQENYKVACFTSTALFSDNSLAKLRTHISEARTICTSGSVGVDVCTRSADSVREEIFPEG
jgi:hypothetical protein